ncbi:MULTISPECIES: transporter substrate-binding domain-containing protein [unclassified Microcoleus]|uniref:transporter substrate-binding domain-containing protein n=1 Tax=unclassified Microcoleus TaxID=2642155 RepID=UPI002FD64174
MTIIMQLLIHFRGGVSFVRSSVLAVGKHFRLGIILALACLACVLSYVPAVSQTSPTQLPNPLKIGVRTSAYEIGNTVSINQAGGFCGTFGEELKQELANNGKQIEVEYYEIKNDGLGHKYPRYHGLKTDNFQEKINIECGPNSKSSNNLETAKGIDFSDPFYETGVKLLLPQKLASDLDLQSRKLRSIKVGVVEETTTSLLLRGIVDNIDKYDTRDEALDALDAEKIEAFASDALILQTILDRETLSKSPYRRKGFTLFKKDGYLTDSIEEYVMAVEAKERSTFSDELIDSINRTLKRDTISQAKQKLKQIENPTPPAPPTSITPPTQTTPDILRWLQEFLSSIFTEILGVFITLLSTFIILLNRTRRGQREHLKLFLWILFAVLCVLGFIIIIAIWLQYKKL